MSLDPKYGHLFDAPNPEQEQLISFIDALIRRGDAREDIESAIIDAYHEDVPVFFCHAYLYWALHQNGDKADAPAEAGEDEAEADTDGGADSMPSEDTLDEILLELESDLALEAVSEPSDDSPEKPAYADREGEADEEDTEQRREQERIALMDRLDRMPGWHNFRRRIHEMAALGRAVRLRTDAGLERFVPSLHTAIVGNPGTGKSTAARLMCDFYARFGLFDDGRNIVSTKVADISSFSSEANEIFNLVHEAQGGALIFEDAHELYHTEAKNYDSEQKIVRALVSALDNKKRFPDWTLILTGREDGIEALLSANPDLKRHFTEPVVMEDFTMEELYRIADDFCTENEFTLSDAARKKLHALIRHKHDRHSSGRGNAYLIRWLFGEQIIPAMYRRLHALEEVSETALRTIRPEDIPDLGGTGEGLEALDTLIGLGKIKSRIKDYLHAVRLAERRTKAGLQTRMPRLHMAFLGNPGTGKTTVADIIGRIFASWGLLSEGRVIRTEKSQMVGQYIGETEFKMNKLLERARGNILFIDEAYQLVEGGEKDYGRIVMNSLLTELGKDDPDMVVIIAGYTAPMKQLLESNEGIESRFPNVFTFEDYTPDELLEIGKLMIRRQGFTLTEGAEEKMRRIIESEASRPSPNFGNGRFVSNLLQNEILASLGKRTAALPAPTPEELSTILPEDVVIDKVRKEVVFDDVAIDAALARLDSLAGLTNVKKAIHNFVRSARYLHGIGEPYVGKGLLAWRFVGKTGTGKSTVAEIMSVILKGMRLISNSHITQIKGERIFNVPDNVCEAVLREAVKKSCNGLIFIDADDPKFHAGRDSYGRSVEQIRLKIAEIALELGGECALILAEISAPNMPVAEQLSEAGVYEFDHTLVFKDFTPEELFDILCRCLERFEISFSPAAERHMREYLQALHTSIGANARTMKIMSRTIHQQVILREAGLTRPPRTHQVQLADIETFKWKSRSKKIGFRPES